MRMPSAVRSDEPVLCPITVPAGSPAFSLFVPVVASHNNRCRRALYSPLSSLAGGDADAADPQRTDVGLYGFGAACFPQEDVAGDIVALRHRIAEQLSERQRASTFGQ